MKAFITLLLLFALASEYRAEDPIVETRLGKVRGYNRATFNGRQFHAFEGIPYAQPPIGKLRFQPPQHALPWEGVLLATRPESECLQYAHVPNNPPEKVFGSEDCLYLNIYKPLNTSKPLPVIFYIHGGAFVFGSGHGNGPQYFLDRDVLLVTINYRLGPLGFLSTGDNVVPGNMGLKDQSTALRWVSENIEFFGGDPKKILLVGLSAGGASVHYQYLSPMSRGLFKGGISLSGSALDCWTQTENSVEKGKKLADLLGCPTDNSEIMIKCLITRPAKSIVQQVKNFMPWLFNPYSPFGPVVEKKSDQPFIDRSPVDIIASGDAADLPWVTSVTSEEGLYPSADFIANEKLMAELNENWNSIAPHLLDYNFTIPQNIQVQVSQKIKKHYLDDQKIDKKTALPLTHMIGDRLFVVDGEKAARMMAKSNKSPVWFYFFSFRGQFSLSDLYTSSTENFGVSHGDDAFLMVYRDPEVAKEKDTLAVQKILLDICVTFANDGIPDAGVKWTKVDPSKEAFEYLHIAGVDNVKMEGNSNLGEKKFWETIDFDENKMKSTSGNRRDEF